MGKFNADTINVNNCNCIGSSTLNDRYSLTLDLNKQNIVQKTAIVILKNPSTTAKSNIFYKTTFANLVDVDRTTSRVINFLYNNTNNYTKIITLNIFPYFSTHPQELNPIYITNKSLNKNQSYNDNLVEVEKILVANNCIYTDVICAWGHNSGVYKRAYDDAVTDVINLINANKRYNLNEAKNKQINNIKWPCPVKKFYPLHGQRW